MCECVYAITKKKLFTFMYFKTNTTTIIYFYTQTKNEYKYFTRTDEYVVHVVVDNDIPKICNNVIIQ